MSKHYYRVLKTGEYVHVGDEISINGNWHAISKSDYIYKKFCDYLVLDDSPIIRRCHPELLENIEESYCAINAVIRWIKISRAS